MSRLYRWAMSGAAIAVLAGCVAEDVTSVRESAVIGGEPTAVGDVPALALLAIGGAQLCTGTLVAPTWVLTAAHCVDSPTFGLEPTSDTARASTIAFDRLSYGDTGGVEVRGRRIVIDPDYDDLDILNGHDLALIQLERPIDDREPMPFNLDPSLPAAGAPITFVGYGRTEPDGIASAGTAHTLTARTPVPCAGLGDDMPLGDDLMICFDQRDGRGVCHGDSGGPVIADIDGVPTAVAVNSFVFDPAGVSCNAYAASTRTDAFAELIESALEDTSTGEDTGGCSAGGGGGGAWPLLLLALSLLRRRRAR